MYGLDLEGVEVALSQGLGRAGGTSQVENHDG
jgi:hypothetical protein